MPVHVTPMSTVIVHFHTPEGFVIASDGRNTSPEGRVLSDEAQKIFPVNGPTVCLAFGLAGTIRIGTSSDQVIFDFEKEALAISGRLAQNAPKTWWDFVSALARQLNDALNAARRLSGNTLSTPTDTTIFIGGVYGKHLKSAHAVFRHQIAASEAEPYLHPPGFHGPFGSKAVFDLIESKDSRFAQYSEPERRNVSTLAGAVQRSINDVMAHCDPEALLVDEDKCRGIGGRIQIAQITFRDGFRWLPGYEPATQRAAPLPA